MSDKWTIQGREYSNCNCSYGCPCQFGAPSTHGFCEAAACGIVEEGHFNDVRLDGLKWAMIFAWPGEIAMGNGRQQAIIDEQASPEQREALRKILHGESTTPGATHFFIFNSVVSEVLETLYRPIQVEIDIEARRGRLEVPGLIESTGSPIIDRHTGGEYRAGIHLPNGFEFTYAEVASGRTRATGSIQLDLKDTYGQFNRIHMNQDGVIR